MKKARRNSRWRRAGLAPRRLTVLAGASLLGFGLLAARAAQLQAVDAERLAEIARRQGASSVVVQAQRNEIVDRHGTLLAMTAGVLSVAASPRQIAEPQRAAAQLARALRLPVREVRRRLESRKPFVWVQRWVESEAAERARRLEIEGVSLHPERRRFYPNGDLAAAYLGLVGRDGRGLSGIEFAFDSELRVDGTKIPALRDARGVRLPQIASAPGAASGRPLMLTLDAKLQHTADKTLQRALLLTHAQFGTLIALDPRNGDVLALAHAPRFDPNRFWLEDPASFTNRAFTEAFEPGSTLKPFSVAIALDAGVVDPDDAFDCESGSWHVLNRTIHDMKPHALLTVHDIVRVSSNIGAAKIANRLGSSELVAGLRRLGFGQRTGSGFPGESPGLLRDLREAQEVERANLAFGQGISVTAIQLATAGAILANGGRKLVPRLALRDSAATANDASALGERVLSKRAARALMGMLREAVSSGTGRKAALADYSVAGKTGTAQKIVDGAYSNDRHVASFLGMVPAADPRLVVVVVLDEPEGVYAGGEVAAPVFREFAGQAARQLGIPAGGAE